MKVYILKPYDVLSFGSLKNFSAGEVRLQKSVFPPPIIRFFHIFERVLGVFLYREKGEEKELFLPLPADCLTKRKGDGAQRVKIAPPESPPLITGDIEAYETASGFISLMDFLQNYEKGSGDFTTYPPEEFFGTERRIGIWLEKSFRNVKNVKREGEEEKEGLLYSRDFIRLKEGVRIAVLGKVHKDVSDREIFGLGGEKKMGLLEKTLDADTALEKEIEIEKDTIYKFYCLTHLYVKDGIQRSKTLTIDGLNFEVVWLFNAGVEYVSGYKKSSQEISGQKPFLEMLKPGSVIVLKPKSEGKLKKLCQIFTEIPVNGNVGEKFLSRGWNSGILTEVKG
ncbi:CRISPR-associated protein Cmr3 [Hydrogenivirga caldilitoris]|uniref:CRISPR-associated protein Cmr3 n=2 Tax=Hydrogenivirga caldilitoris TaxID=246264 RepID=A0A497XRH0_9AQUI|nr:CRISPR-associated protein Cmr3 [Hydrogenivirga caldilitoris]